MKSISALTSMALIIFAAIGGKAQGQEAAPVYVPATTSIAVLPVVNLTGERNQKIKDGQAKAASDELHKQFSSRGFRVIDDKVVGDAISATKIDLTDEEKQSRETVMNIGTAANADLAIFVVINKASSKTNDHFLTSEIEGTCKITVWLIDVKSQKAILSAQPQESKRGRGRYNSLGGVWAGPKGTEQIRAACAGAIKDVLADPLKPYPIEKRKASSEKSTSGGI